jgi:hypothetical protein
VTELELRPLPGDRHLLVLDGVGSIRLLRGWARHDVEVTAGERVYTFAGAPFSLRVRVLDGQGAEVGSYVPRSLGRGGVLRLGERELLLHRRVGPWRTLYRLCDGSREVAVLQPRGSIRPLRMAVEDLAGIDPVLLLLATYVARQTSRRASSAAVAAV